MMNCFKCEKDLQSLDTYQPDRAVTFAAEGQYGSTVFDPMDGSFLEIDICDDCLVLAGDSGFVRIAQTHENLFVPMRTGENVIEVLVGSIRTGHFIPIPWNKDLPYLHDRKFVIEDVNELEREWSRISSRFSFEELAQMILGSQSI